jgi:hypothetical protein
VVPSSRNDQNFGIIKASKKNYGIANLVVAVTEKKNSIIKHFKQIITEADPKKMTNPNTEQIIINPEPAGSEVTDLSTSGAGIFL